GILEIVNRQRVPSDWVVSVFDTNGMRVARSRQHREYIGTGPAPSLEALMRKGGDEGAGITQVLEGESVYTTYSRSHESGWTVAIGIPRSYVEVAALRSLIVYGGGLLLSIGLAVLAALIVGRGIARPMAELGALANAAQLLGAADEETRSHARSVIGRQVQHLARMTDDLLDAARAMTGKIVLQRQPLDLADATARVLSTLRASGRTGQRRMV